MQENSWPENNSYNEFEPLDSLLADLPDLSDPTDTVDLARNLFPRGEGRRRKAAAVLIMIWGSTIALHLTTGGFWLVFGFTTLMGVHALRVLWARSLPVPAPLAPDLPEAEYPLVSLLVAAKNEAAVIGRLVKLLCNLDYPSSRFELWVVDDNSTDQTPLLLEQLSREYPQLRVLRRRPDAGGGKSGALNQVLPLLQGEIIGVFDADAQVAPDLLRRVVPLFAQEQVGAVQVRKAIANAATNFWTRSQATEMVLDAFFQEQRSALGGLGELRGNGQFVRRSALARCGNWNEETITDDLDLTLRLHLDQWNIVCLLDPAVEEEGVTRAIALWHQRNRWAEGGYQSYLDYWRLIARNRLGTRKTFDLLVFWIVKYFLPAAAFPDFLMAIARNRPPVFAPITSLAVLLSLVGTMQGLHRLRKIQGQPGVPLLTLLQAIRSSFYMFHWLPVIASTTARISVRPKRLKWVKTVHQGPEEAWIDLPESS